jgi:hypothetical protein
VSDVTIPSYRVPRDQGAGLPMRLLLIALGLLVAAAAGAVLMWGLGRVGGLGGPRTIPVLEADSRPMKVRPEHPGGMVVPNTDQLVLEPLAVRRAADREQGSNARLAPVPEAPQLDLLRREAAPPASAARVTGGEDAARDHVANEASPAGSALGVRVAALPPPRPAPEIVPMPVSTSSAVAPAATPASSVPGRVQVQLGALITEESARAEWARLQRRVPALAGRQPQITRIDRGPEFPPLWRLRAVGLADAAGARSLCDAVRSAGGACMLVPGSATAGVP